MGRHDLSIIAKVTLTCAISLGAAACSQAPAAPTAAEPAHDIKTMMQIIVQPQADVFWKSTGTISDANGTRDLTPTTDAGWLATQSAAATLAEMGVLLKNPTYAEGKGDDWIEYADALTKISLRAQAAAKAHNPEAVMETGSEIYNVCAACHATYQPPVEPEKIPGSSGF